jgi:hypothetical protein
LEAISGGSASFNENPDFDPIENEKIDKKGLPRMINEELGTFLTLPM